MTAPLSRRELLRLASAGVIGYSVSGWLGNLAAATATDPARRRSCILLWMNGGPSTIDLWDLKPGHANGGPFRETATSVPGVRVSEHLPRLARLMSDLVIVRSMSSPEGDHSRATHLLRTGYPLQPAVAYPALGALVSKELGDPASELPNFVSIAPYRLFSPPAYGPGFLGAAYAPLVVGDIQTPNARPAGGDYLQQLRVPDLETPEEVGRRQADDRLGLVEGLNREFRSRYPQTLAQSHQAAYDRAVRLMRSPAARAFDLDQEPARLRDAYGRNLFGQGCLLARRLVERGVPFVEVTLGGVNGGAFDWDSHVQNFDTVRRLCEVLDPAWATLMKDLRARGLLDSTLLVWMGEFGRTPRINPQQGRDHFPGAFSVALAGGGLRGGQVIGRTSADGTTVEDRRVSVPDLLATVCRSLGINPARENLAGATGRPIRVVDQAARPIREVLP
jgi:hypothetical protein